MEVSAVSFSIETEVTPAYYEELLKYMHQNYIIPKRERFTDVKQTDVEGNPILSFIFLGPGAKWHIQVEIKTGKPIHVTMTPSNANVPQSALNQLKEDLIIVLQFFEEYVRRSTLYFAWIEGEKVVPEKSPFRRARILERILLGNLLFLFVVFITLSIVLFMIFGSVAPLFIVGFQFLTVLFSDKIISRMADWTITEQNQSVHILQYHLPPEVRKDFPRKFDREKLFQMKKEIYDKTLAVGKPVKRETALEVMSKHGLECQPENMATKTVDVNQLVEKTAKRFNLPIPKIAIANTIVPNAAASGPSPKRSVILITTGLLVQLEEDEILTVLGHELSHLKGRDPLVFFGLGASEYLLRIYFLWPYIYFFGFLYFLIIMGIIYFIAKFFEARADLESAIKIGNPKILAGTLRKIGFRRLQFERFQEYRVQDWITWDPHPPIYFRIARLEKLGEKPLEVKHALIQSAKDCIQGFFATLSR